VIFATYYVATYNKMSPISNSGPVQNTIIIQVAVRSNAVSSIKFKSGFKDSLNLGDSVYLLMLILLKEKLLYLLESQFLVIS
jgi:hypothetical protein